MDRAEAEELVASALALAASRDGSSGGLLRLVTVSAAGAERRLIPGDQVCATLGSGNPGRAACSPGSGLSRATRCARSAGF